MSLTETINADIKKAMLAKEKDRLEALRAVKSALLLAATEKGADGDVAEETEIKVLKKLVKQRKDAATIYHEQGRADLAELEEAQAAVIEVYLPQQMSEDKVREIVSGVISTVGASGPQDMGKVMGAAMKEINGQADGKVISSIVKELLAS